MIKQEFEWEIMREFSPSWYLIYEWWFEEIDWNFLRSWRWIEFKYTDIIKYKWEFKNGKYNWFGRLYSGTSMNSIYEWTFVDGEIKWFWKFYAYWSLLYVWEVDKVPNWKWIFYYFDWKRTEWILKDWKFVWECKTYDSDWKFLMNWEPENKNSDDRYMPYRKRKNQDFAFTCKWYHD